MEIALHIPGGAFCVESTHAAETYVPVRPMNAQKLFGSVHSVLTITRSFRTGSDAHYARELRQRRRV